MERALLGGMVAYPEQLDAVAATVRASDFTKLEHRRLWGLLRDMRERGIPIDRVTVPEAIARAGGDPGRFGGFVYAVEAADQVNESALSHYATTIRDAADRRALIETWEDLGARIMDEARTPAEIRALMREKLEGTETRGEPAYKPIPCRTVAEWSERDGEDWLTTEPPPRSWLLKHGSDGLLSHGIVAILASAGGVGKTFALVELAALVAAGATQDHKAGWFDAFTVSSGGRVLFLAGEETEDELRRRLRATLKRLKLPVHALTAIRERLHIVPTAGMDDLALLETDPGRSLVRTRRHREIMDILRGGVEPWSLVVVDPLVRWAAGDIDKDNMAASKVINALEAFVGAGSRPGFPGPCVLVAHHTSKGSRSGEQSKGDPAAAVRGASAITDNPRWAARMDADFDHEDRVKFITAKSNYGKKPTIILRRDGDGPLRRDTVAEAESAAERAATRAKKNANVTPTPKNSRPPLDK